MNRETKTDTLTEVMQRIHPTAEPSAALTLKVAQLAEAKASESAWREEKNKTALRIRRALLVSTTVGILGFLTIVGPRVFYGIELQKAATKLQAALLLKAISYRLNSDGTSQKVGEFYIQRQGKSVQARLERDDFLAIWQGDTLYHSQNTSPLVEQSAAASLWAEDPTNRLTLMAMGSMAFFLRHSDPLERLSDGRLLAQHPNQEERTLIRQGVKGEITELELQVWEQGLWKPFLRTIFQTNTLPKPGLFEIPFPGKKLLSREKTHLPLTSDFMGTKVALRYVFVNSQGEVCISLGIPHPKEKTYQPTLFELTDEKGRRYISQDVIDDSDVIWFFPQESGPAPRQISLTVHQPGRAPLHFLKSVTPSLRQLPEHPRYYDDLSNLLNHDTRRVLAHLRYEKKQKNWARVLELTDSWCKLRDREREIMGEAHPTPMLWLYRTAALRELGHRDEARQALEQARRNRAAVSKVEWLLEEEALLLPK
jgi:hypothetical protein